VKMRNVLEGAGATLLLLPYYLFFLYPSNLMLYHHGLPVNHLIGGFLMDLMGVFLLITGLLVAVKYLPKVDQRIVYALFAGLMLWRVVNLTIEILIDLQYQIHWWDQVRVQSCVVILALSAALAYFLPSITQPAVSAVRLVIAAYGFSAFWIIPQLLHLALVPPQEVSAAPVHLPARSAGDSGRRIVWILFDELSYDQTFDHPAPGVKLPNLTSFRTGSVSFSNLKPVGYFTEVIIPSLFLGSRIDRIRSTVSGDLWYKDEQQNRWLAYDSNATLFALAQRNGWNSAVDGWFIPYCHLLGSTLSICAWEPHYFPIFPMEDYGASEEKSVIANAAVLPAMFLAKLTGRANKTEYSHAREYTNVMDRTRALIGNSQVNFVFLHLPVPHPPGIYDRQRHVLRSGGTYLDNLVLADDTLGTLLQEIDATPSASQTTVIISSDHSWRVPTWSRQEGWSSEEEKISGGHFDDRPVLLIHFPGQKQGSDVNTLLPELLEHDIIADMLLGKISNAEELADFIAPPGK
jgi:hypothetical protein